MVVGDPSVGKTSLIRRFVENTFSEDYLSTLGVDFLKKNLILDEAEVTLVLWDVAGQAKYANFKKYYYQGADFVIIVFDITNPKSYASIAHWLHDFQEILRESVNFAIFANKADLEDQRKVQNYDDYRTEPGLLEIIETSAKTGQNVQQIFKQIGEFLIQKKQT